MMSVLEYAEDVNRTVESILNKCKELKIEVQDENDLLDEDAIVMLDNNLETDEEIEEAYEEEKPVKKVKKKEPVKETPKKEKVKKGIPKTNKNLAKEKKAMYKNKEKLQSNTPNIDENVVIYKENMTIGQLATELGVPSSELIKKLFALGLIVNINSPISYDNAEILIDDYNKKLQRKEKLW